MALVKLRDEVLNESLVISDVADVLLGRGSCDFLGTSRHLWLQQHELVVTALEAEVLAHEVGHVSTNFDLHVLGHGTDGIIVHQEVLFDNFIVVLSGPGV